MSSSCTWASILAARSRRSLRPTPRTLRGNATLSRAFMLGNSRASWNTTATSRRWAGRSSTDWPSKSTWPLSWVISPLTTPSSVDLPAPEAPSTETKEPSGTSKLTSMRRGVPLVARLTESRTICMGGGPFGRAFGETGGDARRCGRTTVTHVGMGWGWEGELGTFGGRVALTPCEPGRDRDFATLADPRVDEIGTLRLTFLVTLR